MIYFAVGAALFFALAAAWARRTYGEPEALALFALALGAATPVPGALAVVAAGLALAGWRRSVRARAEAERASVASYLADWKPGAPPLTRPVSDAVATGALAALRSREAAHARALERTTGEVRPPPGVRARFMAAMGHELRSPLNSILGFAQILEDGSDGPLEEAQRENVVLVRRAAHDLLMLLTDILDAARIEANRVRLDRQWVAPVEVLTLALERLRAQSELELPSIDAELQPGLAPLFVDRVRLGQAVFNVLRAAVRPRAPLLARVRELREGEQTRVRFELHDRGRPITDADALRAFDPDPAARPQGRSLALGLALSVARDLAVLHGGDARAESLDGGTLWIVWVPAASDDPAPSTRGAPRSPRPPPVRGGTDR